MWHFFSFTLRIESSKSTSCIREMAHGLTPCASRSSRSATMCLLLYSTYLVKTRKDRKSWQLDPLLPCHAAVHVRFIPFMDRDDEGWHTLCSTDLHQRQWTCERVCLASWIHVQLLIDLRQNALVQVSLA